MQKPEENETENAPEESADDSRDSKRSYYYDDAHGYEEYDPEKDDAESEESDD